MEDAFDRAARQQSGGVAVSPDVGKKRDAFDVAADKQDAFDRAAQAQASQERLDEDSAEHDVPGASQLARRPDIVVPSFEPFTPALEPDRGANARMVDSLGEMQAAARRAPSPASADATKPYNPDEHRTVEQALVSGLKQDFAPMNAAAERPKSSVARAADMAARMVIEHPVMTAGLALAPELALPAMAIAPAATVGQFAAQQERKARGDWQGPDAVSHRDAAFAAGQLLVPGVASKVAPFLYQVFGQSMARATIDAVESGQSPAQALLAGYAKRNVAHIAIGAGVGAVFAPDDPEAGAILGAAMGGIHAAMRPPSVRVPVSPREPAPVERQIGTPRTTPSPRAATATNLADAPTPTGPDYTVDSPAGSSAAPIPKEELYLPDWDEKTLGPKPTRAEYELFKKRATESLYDVARKAEEERRASQSPRPAEPQGEPTEATRVVTPTDLGSSVPPDDRVKVGEPVPVEGRRFPATTQAIADLVRQRDISVDDAIAHLHRAGYDVPPDVVAAARKDLGEAPDTHEHSSTQVQLPAPVATQVRDFAAKIPDDQLAEDGRETDPHVTVKYGLHTEDPEQVRALLKDQGPITVRLGKTSLFKKDDADVLKVDVDSPELHALNAKIAALPNSDSHPEYKPHATIAYLKPGQGKQYAGDSSLEGQTMTLHELTFSGKNGEKVVIPLTGGKQVENNLPDAFDRAGADVAPPSNPDSVAPAVGEDTVQHGREAADTPGGRAGERATEPGDAEAVRQSPVRADARPSEAAAPAPEAAELKDRPDVPGVEGSKGETFLSTGQRIGTRYRVIEADALQPSHHPESFAHNPQYPAGVQGREYAGARGEAARGQVMTGALRPEVVLDRGSGTTDGPPVISRHGIVVAGNDRSMRIMRAARLSPEQYGRYLETLKARAKDFGIDPAQLDGMHRPVLVRQVDDPSVDTESPAALGDLNRASDTAPTKTKDQVTAAMSRVNAMRQAHAALTHLAETMDPESTVRDYLGTGAGRDFVRELVVDGVIAPQELPAFVDRATNTIHAEGKQKLEDMLYAAAIGNADIMARTPPNVLKKIGPAIPAIVSANQVEGYSLESVLQGALDIHAGAATMRDESGTGKRSIKDFLGQGDMFGRHHDPESARLALFLEGRSAPDVSTMFRTYALAARSAGRAAQSEDIFGHDPETPKDLIKRLVPVNAGKQGTGSSFGMPDRDLFGNETGPTSTQDSLFGANAGTEASRPLASAEKSARSEIDRLKEVERLSDDAIVKRKAAARRADLEKLVNRDKAITSDEMATRAKSESTAAIETGSLTEGDKARHAVLHEMQRGSSTIAGYRGARYTPPGSYDMSAQSARIARRRAAEALAILTRAGADPTDPVERALREEIARLEAVAEPDIDDGADEGGFLGMPDGESVVRSTPFPAKAPFITSRPYKAETYKADPDFKAAKAGDVDAAIRFVERQVSAASIEQARNAFGADVVFAAPLAMERAGPNAIPRTVAEYYAAKLGATTDRSLIQSNKAYHTGAEMMERLVSPPTFEGNVQAGKRYVIVDDVVTSGNTVAHLADYIQRLGGEVAGVVAVANASRSGQLVPLQRVTQRIERRFGDVIRQEFKIDPAALTADEAQYLDGFRSADELRKRAASARRSQAERTGRGSVQEAPPDEVDQSDIDDEAPENREPFASTEAESETPELDKALEEISKKAPAPEDRPLDAVRDDVFGAPNTIGRRMHGELAAPTPPLPGRNVSAPDIINSLADVTEAAGKRITARVGRTGFGRQVLGWWNPQSHVIRTRMANDISTAAHEVAHAVETLLFGMPKGGPWKAPIASRAMQRELLAMGKALYGNQKPAGGYKREGWAEFVRQWITESTLQGQHIDVSKLAPEVHKWFEGEFAKDFPDIRKAMEASRALTRRWRGQGSVARAKASLVDPQSPADRLKEAGRKIRHLVSMEKLVEMAAPLNDLARAAENELGRELRPSEDPYFTLSALRTTHDARVKYMVENAMIDLAGNHVGPALHEITPLIRGRKWDFTIYLWAKRAVALHEDPKGPRDAGLSIEDARQIVQELDSPAFQLAAQNVYDWNDGALNYAAQSSPTFKKVVESVRERDPGNYVPLHREFAELDDIWTRAQGGGGATKRSPVKRLKGSGRRVKDIFPTMLAQTSRLVRQAHQRMVLDQIIRLSQVPGMGQLVEEVPVDRIPAASQKIGDLINQINDRIFEHDPTAKALDSSKMDVDVLDSALTFFAPAQRPRGQDPIVPIYDQGKIRWFHVDGKLYDTLNSLDVYHLPDTVAGMLGNVFLSKPAALMRAGTTGLRASFSLLWNPTRDFQTFYVNTQSKAMAPKLFAEWARAMKDMALSRTIGKESEWVDAWLRLGGEMAQPLGQDIPHTRRAGRRLAEGPVIRALDPRNWFDFYRDLIQFPEGAPRVAELKMMADEVGWQPGQPMSIDQALQLLLASKQVTTDFTAAGELARVVNRMVPFHNAAIQGPRATARAFKRNPGLVAWRMMQLAAVTLALWYKYKDEDWYRSMDPRERLNNWHFPIDLFGKKQIIRIPRSLDIGTIGSSMPEALVDSWYQHDPESVKAWFGQVYDMTPDVTPVLARTVYEEAKNKQFPDRPIVTQSEAERPAQEQYNEYTSRVAIDLGRIFNVSPKRVDHVMNSVGGPVTGDIVSALGLGPEGVDREKEPADLPVIGRLFQRGGELGAQPRQIRKLYEAIDSAQLVQHSTEDPEDRIGKQKRLMLEDAGKAVSAYLNIRRFAATNDRREELTRLARDVAAQALEAAQKEKADRRTFGRERARAERDKRKTSPR